MNKRIISIILALASVCGGAMAQPKVNGETPIREKRGYNQRIVIDTATVRVLYALNAKDIKDENTYLDLGKLEIGKRVKKYSSEFIYTSDLEVIRWKREKGHKGNVPKTFFIRGEKADKWSELVYSDYIVRGNELKEYACFLLWAERENSSYTEPWPLMRWSLADEQQTILGHRCQNGSSADCPAASSKSMTYRRFTSGRPWPSSAAHTRLCSTPTNSTPNPPARASGSGRLNTTKIIGTPSAGQASKEGLPLQRYTLNHWRRNKPS